MDGGERLFGSHCIGGIGIELCLRDNGLQRLLFHMPITRWQAIAIGLDSQSMPEVGGMKALLLICAVTAPSLFFQDKPPTAHEEFFSEYRHIIDSLNDLYPGNEFMIIPKIFNNKGPHGWIRIPLFEWNGHVFYRRERTAS